MQQQKIRAAEEKQKREVSISDDMFLFLVRVSAPDLTPLCSKRSWPRRLKLLT